ncbi:MAG: cyclic beta 1-2 glucan synthetase, partial [Caldimonas sp.]
MTKLTVKAAHELITNMRDGFLVKHHNQKLADEAPLRAELYSAGQMDRFAIELAKKHLLAERSVPGHLIIRLADNEKVLNAVRKLLVEAIKDKKAVSPASEWLIDNFYLIEEQIHTAKQHLPKGYGASLPQLSNGELPTTTRVYDLVLEIVSHSDGKIDEDRLSSFIKSYQSITPLKLGELWAIPIMLRLTLIENLRRVGALVAIDRLDLNLADYWVQKILEVSENDPSNLILTIGELVKSNPPIVSAFVSEMHRRLSGMGSALAAALTWIEQRLNVDGRTTQEFVNAEMHKQGVNQASISNSIGSLRLLTSIDWRDFVEAHSVVEQTLAKEHAGIYSGMDFTTRDSYRHVVEYIAKESRRSEQEVAALAVRLADQNERNEHPYKHKAHVGYFLIGKGRQQTKREAGVVVTLDEKIRHFFRRNRLGSYLGSILLITAVISTLFLFKAYGDNEFGNWLLIVIGILLVLSSSQLAITVVNFFATLLVKPHLLPRMDFSEEIPDSCSTLVIIPAMLTNKHEIETLVEALEVRFLANRNSNLLFGLLTDFTDAETESLPEDEVLLNVVRQCIEELKTKYETRSGKEIFYLFQRPRLWNAVDKIWMGYERKRGKLSDLNGLLQGNSVGKFSLVIGNIKTRPLVKYVITLDADTQLPRGAAWKMVATLAHPLNHALYHDKKKRVTEGYGILQPRVSVSLPEPRSSFYSRLHGNEPGIDPYTRATSDVYQDLFAEGSFIGKGIYEVAVFERALKDRFKENSILSHDLLEGCYIRSGLLSDVELFETYPSSYQSDMKRRARWIRGDWQL